MPTKHRRTLTFHDVSEILPDVAHLEAGQQPVGNWTLAQICHHLAASFNGSIDGFDLRRHRIKRFLMSKRMLAYALGKGIPTNYLVDPGIEPPAEVDEDAAIGALRSAIERYQGYTGDLQSHPLFGRMARDVWDRVHCVHSAHHLRFLIPSGR